MDYRIGTCSQCGAEYKVPASFAHNQARCKQCSGTVNLGEVQGPGSSAPRPAPVPAKKVVSKPKPMEEVSTADAETKRKQRGTLAKLRAERAAAAAQPAKAPQAPKPSEENPEAAATKITPRTKLTGAAAAPKPGAAKPGAAKPGAAKSSRTSSRPARGGSTRGKSSGRAKAAKAEGSGRRGRGTEEKKKSPMLLIAIVLVLGGAGFGAWKYLSGSDDGTTHESQAADHAGATPIEEMDAGSEPTLDEGAAATPEEVALPSESTEDEADPEPEAAPAEAPKDVIVDLAALEPCNRARGTSDEEWEEMNGWLTDFLDPDSGAAGPRAGKKLENLGRKAMPVLINGLLTLDYTTEAGINTGDTVQRMLRSIANGNSFGWWYFDNPRAEYLCTGAAAAWQKAWKQVETNIEAYIKLAKLDREHEGEGEDPLGPLRAQRLAEAAELRSMYGNTE